MIFDYSESEKFYKNYISDQLGGTFHVQYIENKSGAGVPDIILMKDQIYLVEVKTITGVISKAQAEFLQAAREKGCGNFVFVVNNPPAFCEAAKNETLEHFGMFDFYFSEKEEI